MAALKVLSKDPDGEVSYRYAPTETSAQHTNELVMLYSFGSHSKSFTEYEGAWYPGTSIVDNTNIYQVIRKATGFDDMP